MINVTNDGGFSFGKFDLYAVAVEKGRVQWRVFEGDELRFLAFDLSMATNWIEENLCE